MSKVTVSGGLGGTVRVSLEGGDSVELSGHVNAYEMAHALVPFMEALADKVPTLPVDFAAAGLVPVPVEPDIVERAVALSEPPKRTSRAPKGGT